MATRKLTSGEIYELYETAADFVERDLKTSDSPAMHLAPYLDCNKSLTHLSCPIYSVNRLELTRELSTLLDSIIPKAKIGTGTTSDGTQIEYKLHIPILVPDGPAAARGGALKPHTLEWPLALLVIDIVACGLLYYRYTIHALL